MISIHDLSNKIKTFCSKYKEDIFIQIIVIFTGFSSFFIGRLSNPALDNENIYIVNSSGGVFSVSDSLIANSSDIDNDIFKKDYNNTKNEIDGSLYVASSRGKLYYRIGCGGSTKLSETNKIYFKTKEQAEQKGYKPAPNCAP